jgi:endonuclease VIII
MPEGDTIFLAARLLRDALAGERIARFESAYPALTRIDHDRPLAGRTIEAITSRGKHLLFSFSGDLVLHTHLRMNGAWHVYGPGERWRRPARDMRILLETPRAVAVGFQVPVAELLTGRELARHETLNALGPDLLDDVFDRDEAIRRMRARANEAVADVLLDQRVMAGIGNVFKSEILFAAAVNPFAAVQSLDDETLGRIVDVARKQLRGNVGDRARTLAPARGRRTTNSLHPAKGLWLYERAGEPCRKCGARVEARKAGDDLRVTYWCPRCQPPPLE